MAEMIVRFGLSVDGDQLLEGFDPAIDDPVVDICPIVEGREVDPVEIQTEDLLRILNGPSETDHDEHRIPGLVHRLFVVPELVVIAPGNHAPVLGACPELDLHPELPARGDLPEAEIGIDHRMAESPIGVVIGGCPMDELELLGIEHPDDVILKVISKTVEESALFFLASLLFETSFPLDPLAFFLLLEAGTPSLK